MITIKLASDVSIYGIPSDIREMIETDMTVMNPAYIKAVQRRRFWDMPEKFLYCHKGEGRFIRVPIGYYENILNTLNQYGLDHDTIDIRKEEPVKFNFQGDLREYQEPAIQDILDYDNGVLEAGTGAGKTVMALRIIAARGQKTLVIVHTKDLLNQWQERAIQFLGVRPEEIGVIGGGKFRLGRRLTVGIVNSLYNRAEELKKEFGHIVVDECHRTPSRTFSETVGAMDAKYKLGLTATSGRNDNLTDLIFWFLGPLRHIVDKKMLVEDGHILMPQFIMRSTGYNTTAKIATNYVKLIQDLTTNAKRNHLICADILEEYRNKSQIIILSDRKPHCLEIQRILEETYGVNSYLLTGDTLLHDRQKIVNGIGEDKTPVIATGQLIGEGFDSAALDTMFLTTPIKFKGRITQYIGRIMRPQKGKKPKAYDYVDWDVKQLRKSAHSRMRVYGKDNIVQR